MDTHLAEDLADSDETEWFLTELMKAKEIKDTSFSMQIAEAVRMANAALASKKGPRLYNNWMRRMRNRIAKYNGNPEPTIFEKIRALEKKETLFDKIRRL